MNGILVVDKPKGPSSHAICQHFKRTLGLKKAGHAGTLDPLATGVLIILVGGATRWQSLFMGKEKEYRFTMQLGIVTDTYDIEGKILEKREVPSDAYPRLKDSLKHFVGEISQKTPIYSAVKKGGAPLYKLARRGEKITPPIRKVTIHSLKIVQAKLPEITFHLRCSCGTYVRSLAHELGEALGCGAVIKDLRRLRSEPFGIADCISL